VEVAAGIVSLDEDQALLAIDDHHVGVHFWRHPGGRIHLAMPERSFDLIETAALAASGEETGGDGVVIAPMHGQLLEILVTEGDRVRRGDKLAVLEAMKMQHELLAPVDGTVSAVLATAGTQIAADARILEIEPDAESQET